MAYLFTENNYEGFHPNHGKDCWDECDEQQGLCSWCGTGGFCCRKELKLAYIGNGCDGNFGGDNYHACAIPPGKNNFVKEGILLLCWQDEVGIA